MFRKLIIEIIGKCKMIKKNKTIIYFKMTTSKLNKYIKNKKDYVE